MNVRTNLLSVLILLILHCCFFNAYTQCSSCTITIIGIDDTDYNLGFGEKLCVTQTGQYKGNKLIINGGEICNMGFCKPKTVILNEGIVNNFGGFTTANLFLKSSNSIVNNFGVLAVTSFFLMDAGQVNNDSMFNVGNNCNITGDEINNRGELIIGSDLICNALLTNNIGAYIEVGNTLNNNVPGTILNSGCIEIAQDFTNHSIIDGFGVGCGSFKVAGLSSNFGTFGQAGFVDICDDGLPLGGFDVMAGSIGVNVTNCVCGVGTCIASMGTFPIELLSFYINSIDRNEIDLKWVTQTEINNDYFTIERSNDAVSFVELAKISGAGFSYDISEYSWKDENPLSGTSYYRLKYTDNDGDFSYSEIQSAYIKPYSSILVYPNPTRDEICILIENKNSELISVQLFDELGSLIKEIKDASNKIKLNIHDISSGMYMLRIIKPENGTFSQKIIIN